MRTDEGINIEKTWWQPLSQQKRRVIKAGTHNPWMTSIRCNFPPERHLGKLQMAPIIALTWSVKAVRVRKIKTDPRFEKKMQFFSTKSQL